MHVIVWDTSSNLRISDSNWISYQVKFVCEATLTIKLFHPSSFPKVMESSYFFLFGNNHQCSYWFRVTWSCFMLNWILFLLFTFRQNKSKYSCRLHLVCKLWKLVRKLMSKSHYMVSSSWRLYQKCNGWHWHTPNGKLPGFLPKTNSYLVSIECIVFYLDRNPVPKWICLR